MGRCTLIAVLFSALFAFVACGHDPKLDAPANACVLGQTVRCACTDGTSSYQRCGADGSYGACQCDGQSSDGVAGESARDAGGSANGGAAGGAGAAGSGSRAGSGGSAGTAGSPVTTPTAGSGSGGSGGVAGSSVHGGSGGSGGSAGTRAGSGGDGGFGGSAEAGSGGTPAPMTGPPPMGSAFGRCRAGDSCNDGLLCVNTSQSGNTEGYCAPECETFDDGSTSDCPQPTTGDVEAICVSFANLCALTPCGEAACPRGMECTGRSGQGNQQGLCQYPMR